MVAGWGFWDGYLPFVDNFIRLDYVDGNKLSRGRIFFPSFGVRGAKFWFIDVCGSVINAAWPSARPGAVLPQRFQDMWIVARLGSHK